MKKEFIGTTIGMIAYYPHAPRFRRNVMTRAEFYRLCDKKVEVRAVSAYNLSRIPYAKKVVITREEFDNREIEIGNDVVEWKWAMQLLGIETFLDDDEFDECR